MPTSILEQVEEGEDEDPDEVDEMPVKTGHLHSLRGGLALKGTDQGDGEDHEAGENVGAVESGEEEEGLAELGRPPGVAREAGAFVDEVAPLDGLAGQKRGAPPDSEGEVQEGLLAITQTGRGDSGAHE